MSTAAAHLGIDLAEYDSRIRTFIPFYEELLRVAAAGVAALITRRAPVIVDLGTGTGALAEAVHKALPAARIVAIDEDAGMLAAAGERLGARLTSIRGSFERVALPRCDACIASLALHHLPTSASRIRLFRRVARSLRPGGFLLSADCYPPSAARLRAVARLSWMAHLETTYAPSRARAYLRAWAREDRYVPLVEEMALLRRAGLRPDVFGRRGMFAVVIGARSKV